MFKRNWTAVLALAGLGALPQAALAEVASRFVVNEDTSSLSLVSLYLYGDLNGWKELARVNGIKPPYRLKNGQALIVGQVPTLNPEQGREAVLHYWRGHFGLADRAIVAVQRPKATRTVASTPVETGRPLLVAPKKQERLSAEQDAAEGLVLEKQKRYADAFARFSTAARTKPDYLPARLGEIRTLRQLERRDEARERARALVDEHPEYGDLPFVREAEESP